ncbi:MAG: hypothetical protein ABIT58_09225, partial [Ferruginibacter sp.]
MKKLLCLLFLATTFSSNAQKIFFPSKNFSDSSKYEQTIAELAAITIPLYSNKVKINYYDVVFRLNFAKQDYKAVIQSLDSFDVNAGIDKSLYHVPGFHYRMHSMTMLAMNGDKSKDYNTEYARMFNAAFRS